MATTFRLRRAARGDAAAFAALYKRHHQALYRYCRSILRHDEDAQDALQSTMAKAFAALQTEQRDIELRPWLFRIAHNEAISILRRRRETEELGDVPEIAPMEDRVLEREELRALQMDLAELPDRQRAALVLRELNGLSHAEIAAVLETTPTNVKHTIFEARTSLFACREGREMPCHDVRRMLSDGDGRILRGRGIRAHLRSCPDCRRFKADLERRPIALKLLAPPLPTTAAASLLSSLLGGGTAAKLLACVAIAGGGATIAVETHESAKAPPAVAAEKTPTSKPKPARVSVAPVPTVAAATRTPPPRPATTQPRVKRASAKKPHKAAVKAHKPRKTATKQRSVTAPGVAKKPGALPPGQAKKPTMMQAKAQRKAAKPAGKVQRKAADLAAKVQRRAAKVQRKAATPSPPAHAKTQAAVRPASDAKAKQPKRDKGAKDG